MNLRNRQLPLPPYYFSRLLPGKDIGPDSPQLRSLRDLRLSGSHGTTQAPSAKPPVVSACIPCAAPPLLIGSLPAQGHRSAREARSRRRSAGHYPCGIINAFGLLSRKNINTREGIRNCYDLLTGYWVSYRSTSASILARPTHWSVYAIGVSSSMSHPGWRSTSALAAHWP